MNSKLFGVKYKASGSCGAWIGLEPPEWVECELDTDHELPHKALLKVSERIGDGIYKTIEAVITWPVELEPCEHE